MQSGARRTIDQQLKSSAPPRLRYRAEIDGLRAVAVSLVVMFHAGFWGTPGGYVGVDVFYVISGYLITSLLVRELDERDAASLFPAVELAAKKQGWKLLIRTKAACPSMNVSLWSNALRRPYAECDAWRTDVLSEIVSLDPDLILLANSSAAPPAMDESGGRIKADQVQNALLEGETSLVHQILDHTRAQVVLVRDVPRLPEDPVTCLVERPMNENLCSWPKRRAVYPRGRYEENSRVKVLDLNSDICPSETCKAVLNDHIIMRDNHHLTASFAATLAQHFQALFGSQKP